MKYMTFSANVNKTKIELKVEDGELSGRKLYFVFQGAAPEKWMLDAGEYTMKRFAGLYGMTYGGMATNKNEATKLGKNI